MLLFITGKYGGFRAMLPGIKACAAQEKPLSILFTDQHLARADTGLRTLELCVEKLPGEVTVYTCPDREKLFGVMNVIPRPEAVIVYGDRLEALLAAAWGHENRVRVMHLQAGDISGGVDDGYRIAIAHIASHHFAPDEEARLRLRRVDVMPETIHVVGDHHVDAIMECAQRPEPKEEKLIICHLHPDTLASAEENARVAGNLWAALDRMRDAGYRVICLPPCQDRLREAVLPPRRFDVREHIEMEEYIPLLQRAALFVGNSSTAVIECPVLGVRAMTIGLRQEGRDYRTYVNRDYYSHMRIRLSGPRSQPSFVRGRGNAWNSTIRVFERLGLL